EGQAALARQAAATSTPLPQSSPLAQPSVTRQGSSPSVREALGIPPTAPLLSPDGAPAHETPVEPRDDDDDDDHETLLMDREAAAAEIARARAQPASPPAPQVPPPPAAAATPPPRPSAPFSEGPPSKSIESFMVPAPPPPSRTPQLVAIGVALLM